MTKSTQSAYFTDFSVIIMTKKRVLYDCNGHNCTDFVHKFDQIYIMMYIPVIIVCIENSPDDDLILITTGGVIISLSENQ